MEFERSTINILLIEDNPGDALLIIEYLSRSGGESFDVTIAERLESGIELLREKSFDVVVLDLTLPDSDGLGTFEKVYNQSPMVPVIVLTGLDDQSTGIAAVKAGAQDYLLKMEVSQSVIVRTIRHSIERASLERQILESNQLLEERVKLRTAELEAARERASRSEKLAMIGQLSGGIAHDLRNPLGAIKNAAYYLKRKYNCAGSDQGGSGQGSENIPEWIDLIDREVTNANNVITNLLSYGSTREPVFSEIQISDVINGSLERITFSENIFPSLTADPDLPPVLGDAAHLTRVFLNLLVNAQEAMGRGGCLSIGAHRQDETVKIVISDTGSGISPENLEKIFDPLYTDKTHGTGLGLAVCQEIISKHNGSISVDSEIGTGTSFTILIPIAP